MLLVCIWWTRTKYFYRFRWITISGLTFVKRKQVRTEAGNMTLTKYWKLFPSWLISHRGYMSSLLKFDWRVIDDGPFGISSALSSSRWPYNTFVWDSDIVWSVAYPSWMISGEFSLIARICWNSNNTNCNYLSMLDYYAFMKGLRRCPLCWTRSVLVPDYSHNLVFAG